MACHDLDRAAREVIACFDLGRPLACQPLAGHGGFSGACLWHVSAPAGPLALKAWPPETTREFLTWVHHLMDAAGRASLSFIPRPARTRSGTTWAAHDGRLWDLATWVAGLPDDPWHPSQVRLQAGAAGLARLHAAWSDLAAPRGPCPGVHRRLARADAWLRLVASGWRPDPGPDALDPVAPWAARAWPLALAHVPRIPPRLRDHAARAFDLQPCLCDSWSAHFLYQGETLTGIIDYGSVKVDHPAVDLARLLAGFPALDSHGRDEALAVYRQTRPLTEDEVALLRVLWETGPAIAAANWLTWLYHDRRRFPDRQAVAERLVVLVRILEDGDAGRVF